MALVETRRRTLRPSASEMKVTLHRFGRKRRLVLMLEWLTLWPTSGPLAVSSQRRDMSKNPLIPSPAAQWRLKGVLQRLSCQRSAGRIGGKGCSVKVLTRAKCGELPFWQAFEGFSGPYKGRIPKRQKMGCSREKGANVPRDFSVIAQKTRCLR